MRNWIQRTIIISLIYFVGYVQTQCSVTGTFPPITEEVSLLDIDEGIFWQRGTTNIASIQSTGHDENTGNREYMSTDLVDSDFVLATTALFKEYEEHETSHITHISVAFNCASGSNNFPLTIAIHVIDTNNHAPEFILPPSGEFIFTIFTPVPPGYEITSCLNDITVRDIDLTTIKIDFEIEDNPYFEIDYDDAASTTDKEFKAKLVTKTFIRNLPDPIVLKIIATDVDKTGDPRLTAETTVTIIANTEFELPEEPVFSKTFYLAEYTRDDQVILTEPITLQSGYDQHVNLYVQESNGDDSANFELEPDPYQENQRSIRVLLPLSGEVLMENTINLIVRAERELTSGASATVILRLPEVVPLEFDRAHYQGTIENNNLDSPQLILSQGYEGETVTAAVRHEYATYFTARVEGNKVLLTMGSLDENILEENSFLNLEVYATTGRSTTTTIVTLDIIKEDNVTPVFESSLYKGTYLSTGDLTHDRIELVQGYDGIEEVTLLGEHERYFIAKPNGAFVTIDTTETIPPELYSIERIALSLQVRKPRTVGASAAVIITLPAVVPLEFDRAHYQGTIENNNLDSPQLILSQGYEGETVTAAVRNEYSTYFTATVEGNKVTLVMGSLDDNILEENSFLNLEVYATTGRSTTTTIVTLEIIKEDNVTPVFASSLYKGTYSSTGDLTHDRIELVQGYDGIEEVTLLGEHERYFIAKPNGAFVTIDTTETIPPELYSIERIALSLQVRKPRTVGASAAVIITLPAVVPLEFDRAHYQGTIKNNNLDSPQLILSQGYEGETVTAAVRNEYSTYFTATVEGNKVTLVMGSLDDNILEENSFLNLEVYATTGRSTTTTIVTLEIIKEDNVTPVFASSLYKGTYSSTGDLTHDRIELVQGYDGIEEVTLLGEHERYFIAKPNGAFVTIDTTETIPPELYSIERIALSLQVRKPRTVGASAAVIITLPAVMPLEFDRAHYQGTIENNNLNSPQLILSQGYEGETVTSAVRNEYATYFTASVEGNKVTLTMGSLDENILEENSFLNLEVYATTGRSTTTTIVTLEIIKEDNVTPVFASSLYKGTYSSTGDLTHDRIELVQGYDGIEEVTLLGEHERYFIAKPNGAFVTIDTTETIPPELYSIERIALSLQVRKPRTVGASAAVIITLPAVAPLEFDRAHYQGTIENNNLDSPQLILSQGYEGETVTAAVRNEYETYFTARVEGNKVSLIMGSLDENILEEKSFLNLEVYATTGRSTTTTIVTLEIIKEDNVTPVFASSLYKGTYSSTGDLTHDRIELVQGYDGIEEVTLLGEHERYFIAKPNGAFVTIDTTETIPPELYSIERIALSLQVRKPRTVGASAAVIITLPADSQTGDDVKFERVFYEGFIQQNEVQHELITVTGYYGTSVLLFGELSSLFVGRVSDGEVRVQAASEPLTLPTDLTHLTLEMHVAGARAVLLLNVLPSVVPLEFDRAHYQGTIENNYLHSPQLILRQGYEGETVTAAVRNEYATYFTARVEDNKVTLTMGSLDENIIKENSFLNLEVYATTGRSTTTTIVTLEIIKEDNLTPVFASSLYKGTYSSTGDLTHDRIELVQGYDGIEEVTLLGEHDRYFIAKPNGAFVTIDTTETIPPELYSIERIVLSLQVRKPRTVGASAAVIITLPADSQTGDDVTFERVIYEGFIQQNEVQHELITVTGYYGTSVQLVGELASLFVGRVSDGEVRVQAASEPLTLPTDLTHLTLEMHVAGARAVLLLNVLPSAVPLEFDRAHYQGTIENNYLHSPQLILSQGYEGETVTAAVRHEYATYFTASVEDNKVTLTMGSLDENIIKENSFLNLEVYATTGRSTTTTIVTLEIIKEDNVTPVFASSLYKGTYSSTGDLTHDRIELVQGYDGIEEVTLLGEHDRYFIAKPNGAFVTIDTTETIPPELYSIERIVLSLQVRKPRTVGASAAVIITLPADSQTGDDVTFERVIYEGFIQQNEVQHELITVNGYYGTSVQLVGELASLFVGRVSDGEVRVQAASEPLTLPTDLTHLTLEMHVAGARAVLLLNVLPSAVPLEFDRAHYQGTIENNYLHSPQLILSQGYEGETVTAAVRHEYATYFTASVEDNKVTLTMGSLDENIIKENSFLNLEVYATTGRSTTTTIVTLEIIKEDNVTPVFASSLYKGTYSSTGDLTHDRIELVQGYDGIEEVTLLGEHERYFIAKPNGAFVTIDTTETIPPELYSIERIALSLQVRKPRTVGASAAVIITLPADSQTGDDVTFERVFYEGFIQQNEVQHELITVTGYYGTSVQLVGELSSLFVGRVSDGEVRVQAASEPLTLPTDLTHLTLEMHVAGARAVLLLNVLPSAVPLEFDRAHYQGTIENNYLHSPQLILSQGYEGETVTAAVRHEYATYFTASVEGNKVTLTMGSLDENIIKENSFLNLEVYATTGRSTTTTIVTLEIIKEDNVTPVFASSLYKGTYSSTGDLTHDRIELVQGYDGIEEVTLLGEHERYFIAKPNGAFVTIDTTETIPPELYSIERIALSLQVRKPRTVGASAAVIITLPADSQTGDDVTFERVFYEGSIQQNEVQHEFITVTGYYGTSVQLVGELSSLFVGRVSDGEVRVQAASEPLTLPTDLTHLTLEMHVAGARAVLLLNVLPSDVTLLPSVTFSSDSYMMTVDMAQTGLVGRVSATADNGEAVAYLLEIDDAHLLTRLSINSEGELHLSAPANSGVYTIEVIATTVITQAKATALVHLRVEAVTICDDKGVVTHPLIILDRDEEAAHNNLVVLDPTEHAGCHFTLTNHWPTDQTWLYVDENGLHTTAIDREHPSIAFMALSQVQVELILHCDSDSTVREKRSERTDRLGPYDYSRNKWIFTDTITYNSRRSLVNLIVNDINDNYPIFVGKEHEPIAVGYPTEELEERVLPRSLAELQATDADIGENAALRYWSSESVLAVAPATGFVHVRAGARLAPDQLLTVTATDQNGQGLSGTIQLLVKLLDLNHIAVVTVRGVFLDDERTVLTQLSDAVGYEVKSLKSVVISDAIGEDAARNTRDVTRASLQLYVYGINEREPVTVDRLAADISNNAPMAGLVSIPLEDHLQDMNILDNQNIGLLVSTIVLAVLLFIVILLVAIFFFLRWRKNKNYNDLNDESSLASRNASLGELPKPEVAKPRLNIEDLKKSEKRLQEMLHAPIQEVTVEQVPRNIETPAEAILDLVLHEPSAPIVIQSIDKLKDADESSDDEFGEIRAKPRKSVVTFNENVEKIIHVEDNVDGDGDDNGDDDNGIVDINVDALNTGYEIYKL